MLVALLFNLISATLIVGNFYQDPWLICSSRGCTIAEATDGNICHFLRQMRRKCVNSAVISGYNGCKRRLVLYANGKIRPYNPCIRVNAAFCAPRRVCCQVCFEVGDCRGEFCDYRPYAERDGLFGRENERFDVLPRERLAEFERFGGDDYFEGNGFEYDSD